MISLVLVRHGESEWNKANRFTGWQDVSLSDEGRRQAQAAGRLLKERGFVFDQAFASPLKRAKDTLAIILEEMASFDMPTATAWQLNERHYGALEGLNKDETREKYGEEQVKIWRRSYDVRPPAIPLDDPRHPKNNSLYREIPTELLPCTESLRDVEERLMPYFNECIQPMLLEEKKILVVAHGNSLRALIKNLDNLSAEEIMEVEIPVGSPLVYELEAGKPWGHYYLN